jgi:trk system potassium uptake protein TrkA
MHIIVAGCGRVGSQLADSLSYETHDVVVIDKDPSSFRRLGATFNGMTLEGVSFDEEVLLEAGIEHADALAAVTNFDNTNLMTSEIATNLYGVPTVLSRLYSPGKELTYFKLGIDYVCSTTLLADRIREKLFQGHEVVVQNERLDIGVQILEFLVTEDGEGKRAGNFNYGVSSRLIRLLRDNSEVAWTPETPLRPGDRALVAMRKEGWRVIRDCLGEEPLNSRACRLIITPSSLEAIEGVDEEPAPANVVIAGCSAVGAQLAYLLSIDGHGVTVIDENPALFYRLPKQYSGGVIQGSALDEETLIKAGIEEADAFAAVTKLDNTNLMASEVAWHVFNVPHVIARLFNPDKETTFQALGLNYVCGTRLLAQTMLERMLKLPIRARGSCFNNLLDVFEFECPPSWDGLTMRRISDRNGISIAYVLRRSSGYLGDANFVLREGDTITAVAGNKRLRKLARYLRKHREG